MGVENTCVFGFRFLAVLRPTPLSSYPPMEPNASATLSPSWSIIDREMGEDSGNINANAVEVSADVAVDINKRDDSTEADDGVDTTLTLGNAFSNHVGKSKRCSDGEKKKKRDDSAKITGNHNATEQDDDVDTTLTLGINAISKTNNHAGKRKRGSDGEKNKKKKKKTTRRSKDEDSGPVPSLEEVPGLLRALEGRHGTNPVFLYRKKLTRSDADGYYGRLFVNDGKKLMEFLNFGEVAAMEQSKDGLEVCGVDQQGGEYKMKLKRWASLNQIVVACGWSKLAAGNNAEEEDCVQMWGYRDNGEPRLAFNFNKIQPHP